MDLLSFFQLLCPPQLNHLLSSSINHHQSSSIKHRTTTHLTILPSCHITCISLSLPVSSVTVILFRVTVIRPGWVISELSPHFEVIFQALSYTLSTSSNCPPSPTHPHLLVTISKSFSRPRSHPFLRVLVSTNHQALKQRVQK